MMRIGIDYTSAARQRAGIGRYTRELVAALLSLESAHQYTIFAAAGGLKDDEWRLEVQREGVRLRTVPLSDDWLARLWHRLRLPIPVEVATGPLDVFYSPDFTLPPTVGITRTLLTVHDLSFMHHPDAFVPSLQHYLEKVVPRSIDRADLVLADSAHTRSDLITLFGVSPEAVRVIHPGVDSRFRPEPDPDERERLRERYGIGDKPYVLSVGTLQPRKNYVRLIEAFAQFQTETDGKTQLLIAGGRGWLYDDILAEAKRHEDVQLLGFVADEDLPALYRGATLFAFISLYEGFGLPVLEAMACGVPVVCSNTSSLPEVAGDSALLVDPLSPDELTEALIRVSGEEGLRQAMIHQGLARAADFTWERSALQLLDVIDSFSETSRPALNGATER
jgi:glycosyltransferase involved in cell wall biosynthesis